MLLRECLPVGRLVRRRLLRNSGEQEQRMSHVSIVGCGCLLATNNSR